jgi:hypothetical protein
MCESAFKSDIPEHGDQCAVVQPAAKLQCTQDQQKTQILALPLILSIYYKYGIIVWGNSSNSRKIFTLQKKIIRTMAAAQPRTACRSLFK